MWKKQLKSVLKGKIDLKFNNGETKYKFQADVSC